MLAFSMNFFFKCNSKLVFIALEEW